MGVISKSRVLLPALFLIFQAAQAQFFADMNMKRRHMQGHMSSEDNDEDRSAVDKLDASATWWDYLVA